MENIFIIASIWIGLAVLSTVIAYHLKISIALIEICIGVAAGAIANYFFGNNALQENSDWLRFIASVGAILLTFLAGTELDPKVIAARKAEVLIVGAVGFLAPFTGCALVAKFILNWSIQSSLLAGVALSTTSMAVVYAVMLETGFNKTDFGKGILAACFINDLGTVILLGVLFSPFTYKTIVFVAVSAVVLFCFPFITKFFTKMYGNRTAAIRAKWIIFVLIGLGALAFWSGSEAVLPAYIAGIMLAEFAVKEDHWIRRIRTLTVGFLTPFYFLRAGTLVSIPAIIATPLVLLVLFGAKAASKVFGLYPVIARFRKERSEKWYYTLMMSTGLTFGTISALFGLSHGIIDQGQYSFLVAAVIASAVIPTLIAGFAFVPKHLLHKHVEGEGIIHVKQFGIDEE